MSWLRNTVTNLTIKFLLIAIRGGENRVFVTIAVALVVAKRKNINEIPASLREDVLADLEALGLDGYGNPLTEN